MAELLQLAGKREKFALVSQALSDYATSNTQVNINDVAGMISTADRAFWMSSQAILAMEDTSRNHELLPEIAGQAIDRHMEKLAIMDQKGGSARRYLKHQRAIDRVLEEFE